MLVRCFVLVVVLWGFAVVPASQATDVNLDGHEADDDGALIEALFDRLVAAFSDGNAKDLAANVFAENGIRVLDDRVQPLTGRAGTRAFFEQYISGLRAEGYRRSAITGRHVCLLSAHEAVATIAFRRYDGAGRVIAPGPRATTFVLHKSPAGWRIAAAFGHDPDKAIGCKD